jgi:hypothetical protein
LRGGPRGRRGGPRRASMRLLRLLLLAAALVSCRSGGLMAEDEERLPGWLGEVSREVSGGGGSGGRLRGGATKALSKKQQRDAADAQRAKVARLPADGIPVPGTVHPEARGHPLDSASPRLCATDATVRPCTRSRGRLSS